MRILVTGGTGVVGQAAVAALLRAGHTVRLFSRRATAQAREWPPSRIEAVDGSVASAGDVQGCAADCDVVVHAAGIVAESAPGITYANTNVEGTRHIVREAERARAGRLIYLSSLGADTGQSPYHASKRSAEAIVRDFRKAWLILRPGNVYGPGDDVISLLLKMVRSLPAVPIIDDGDHPFQPMWAGDIGAAIATAVARPDLSGQTLALAGPERTTLNDVLDRLGAITGRSPARVPVPGLLAALGSRLADWAGIELPVTGSQLTMLVEGNVIEHAWDNALTSVLEVTPTRLDEGLRLLADAQPEQLPSDGVGALRRKRFWAEIGGCSHSPESLFALFATRFARLTPRHMDLAAEPGTPDAPLAEGTTLTMELPLRGNVQVRVQEITARTLTLATLEGHPLAAGLRFLAEQRGDALRFEVQLFERAANRIDWMALLAGGAGLQDATWVETVENVVSASGGRAARGVERESQRLNAAEAALIDEWLAGLIAERKREERAGEMPNGAR